MEKKTIVVIGYVKWSHQLITALRERASCVSPWYLQLLIRAGVAGLTTAMLLSKNPAYRIIVAAKHMPGDYDIEYASPWAGANYMP
jgi:hypothetical protein